jgi:hypothetical protein
VLRRGLLVEREDAAPLVGGRDGAHHLVHGAAIVPLATRAPMDTDVDDDDVGALERRVEAAQVHVLAGRRAAAAEPPARAVARGVAP